jgi:hypothetical protein
VVLEVFKSKLASIGKMYIIMHYYRGSDRLLLPLLRDHQPITSCISYIRLTNQMCTKPVKGSAVVELSQIWERF